VAVCDVAAEEATVLAAPEPDRIGVVEFVETVVVLSPETNRRRSRCSSNLLERSVGAAKAELASKAASRVKVFMTWGEKSKM
jgi:hypothetical protein